MFVEKIAGEGGIVVLSYLVRYLFLCSCVSNSAFPKQISAHYPNSPIPKNTKTHLQLHMCTFGFTPFSVEFGDLEPQTVLKSSPAAALSPPALS